MSRKACQVHPNAFAKVDLLAAVGSAIVLFAVATTVLARNGGGSDAHYKLVQLAQAQTCYANDWNDRQWTALPDDVGQYGDDCASYLAQSGACPPQQFLGFDTNGAMWGYFLGSSGSCAAYGYPGNCGNWVLYTPFRFDTSGYGSCFVPNTVGFRQYVSQRFYAPDWYAEDDPSYAFAATHFDMPYEFTYNASTGLYADSSFCLSPAAMFDPGVLRRPSAGGFHSPSGYVDSYRAPNVSKCLYPSLKSRMCEWGWFRGAPEPGLAFSAGLNAAPMTLFFDGSVSTVRMREAYAQDRIVMEASAGLEGLWSRDTPLGADGWRRNGQVSLDGSASGYHILTTDGILGRDLLMREADGTR